MDICVLLCVRFTEAAHSSSTNVLQLSGRAGVEVKVEVSVYHNYEHKMSSD